MPQMTKEASARTVPSQVMMQSDDRSDNISRLRMLCEGIWSRRPSKVVQCTMIIG